MPPAKSPAKPRASPARRASSPAAKSSPAARTKASPAASKASQVVVPRRSTPRKSAGTSPARFSHNDSLYGSASSYKSEFFENFSEREQVLAKKREEFITKLNEDSDSDSDDEDTISRTSFLSGYKNLLASAPWSMNIAQGMFACSLANFIASLYGKSSVAAPLVAVRGMSLRSPAHSFTTSPSMCRIDLCR